MDKISFLKLRKQVIEKDFSNLNNMQFRAAVTADGPVLILAGAGSGKTTVLVNRIAYLVKYGDAYMSDDFFGCTEAEERAARDFLDGSVSDVPKNVFSVKPAYPWEILAITFTNKAAGELKDRIAAKLGEDTGVVAGTFHSICGRILRRFAPQTGYTSHFTVYDTDDQKRLMKEIMKGNNVSDREFTVKSVLSEISSAKDKLISPEQYAVNAGDNYRLRVVAQLYAEYDKRLKTADAMDFDDMIVNTVRLLQNDADVKEYYNNKFKYVMVDEYQDTNYAQYVLVKLLSEKRRNICVVGDDDQSIYRFRGATIENILNFEDEYPESTVIRLEQNYRSTENILNAANAVIANNRGRKRKTLWTDNGTGEKVHVYKAASEQDEARRVAEEILQSVRMGGKFSDNAVLYRMNAQSNAVENVFARSGIPYAVIGGTRFFDRKEIKDVIAYLCLINNNNDDIRLKRIINEPKRGIGDTTVKSASEIANQLGTSVFEVLCSADDYAALTRSSQKLTAFTDMIKELSALEDTVSINELLYTTLEKTGYLTALEAEGEEGADRIDNVKELSSSIIQYELENPDATLSGFLEEVALISDIDSYEEGSDRVVMMTVHSAKGLEFENVYLVGMEEGIFPGNQSIFGGENEIEEERRLAYVAITRAKKNLYISNADMRMLYGSTTRNVPSRFLREIPDELCEKDGGTSSFFTHGADSAQGYTYVNKGQKKAAIPTVPHTSPLLSDIYSVGERVEHKTFGTGTVLSVQPMGQDMLLEIAFDEKGTKKLMAAYAKLKKL